MEVDQRLTRIERHLNALKAHYTSYFHAGKRRFRRPRRKHQRRINCTSRRDRTRKATSGLSPPPSFLAAQLVSVVPHEPPAADGLTSSPLPSSSGPSPIIKDEPDSAVATPLSSVDTVSVISDATILASDFLLEAAQGHRYHLRSSARLFSYIRLYKF